MCEGRTQSSPEGEEKELITRRASNPSVTLSGFIDEMRLDPAEAFLCAQALGMTCCTPCFVLLEGEKRNVMSLTTREARWLKGLQDKL